MEKIFWEHHKSDNYIRILMIMIWSLYVLTLTTFKFQPILFWLEEGSKDQTGYKGCIFLSRSFYLIFCWLFYKLKLHLLSLSFLSRSSFVNLTIFWTKYLICSNNPKLLAVKFYGKFWKDIWINVFINVIKTMNIEG